MSLVGDVIMSFREQATDLPVYQLASPGAELTVAQAVIGGGTGSLVAGNYKAKAAYRNVWGETLAGAEATIAVDNTHTIQVSVTAGSLPPGVQSIVLYISPPGGAAGSENQAITIPVALLPFNVLAPSNIPGFPVLRNTAYLPDSDGRALSVAAAYRLLNDALKAAAGYCGGGLPDITGIPSIVGQGMYTLPGQWWKLDRFWYDGYPGSMTGSDAIFRKNPVRGNYAMSCTVESVTDRFITELWPQPARTAGITTTTALLSATSSSVTLAASNFTLAFGFAQLSDAQGNMEIVSYNSNSGGTMQIAIRGLGGTVQRAWPIGTTVQELNIVFRGLRVSSPYSVGSAYATLNVPPGWEDAIVQYLLSRFREAERDGRTAERLRKGFQAALGSLPTNRPVGGPRQIQIGGARGVETYPGLGSFFGGVIVP